MGGRGGTGECCAQLFRLGRHACETGCTLEGGCCLMSEIFDTVVIGGGQAGLVASHALTERGIEHVVLERHRVAERWRTERWDSLRFQFPNTVLGLPGMPYDGPLPDGFAHHTEVVRWLERYRRLVGASVREQTPV